MTNVLRVPGSLPTARGPAHVAGRARSLPSIAIGAAWPTFPAWLAPVGRRSAPRRDEARRRAPVRIVPRRRGPSLRGHPRRGATPREDAAQREAARGDVSRGGLVHPRLIRFWFAPMPVPAVSWVPPRVRGLPSARAPRFHRPPRRHDRSCVPRNAVHSSALPPCVVWALIGAGSGAGNGPFGAGGGQSSVPAGCASSAWEIKTPEKAVCRLPKDRGCTNPIFCVVPPCLY